jgi:putative transposase
MVADQASVFRIHPATKHRSESRRKEGERGIWRGHFWEHTIRDAQDFAADVDYVPFNPA